MKQQLFDEELFENKDYSETKLSGHEFLHCEFRNCDFTKTDLSNNEFSDCLFINCNFSLALLNNTGLQNITFDRCKLMGLDFSRCNDFSFSTTFRHCAMDYCSFFKKKMKKTLFTECSLREVDFTEADLSMAAFQQCDLLHATFDQTILESADFRTARNYSLDPELNKVRKAKFSYMGLAGLLGKYDLEVE